MCEGDEICIQSLVGKPKDVGIAIRIVLTYILRKESGKVWNWIHLAQDRLVAGFC
jgi:hypothetical protein